MPGRARHPQRPFLPLGPDRTFILLAALLVAASLMGGGSRADIESLALLRPFACLAAAVGVLGLDRATLRAWRLPFLLLAALAVVMVLQLIPLPPSWWTQLPGRETIAQLDVAVGLADTWRPLTLSPTRAANALASLIVPFAVLVLFCQLDDAHRRKTLLVIVVLAAAGALLGVLQLLAGADSPLRFYARTHRFDAVGFFANRNHHTVFLAATMLVALHLAMDRRRAARDVASVFCFAAAVVMLVAVIGNVSRAGLLSAAVALVLVPLVISGDDRGGGNEQGPDWFRTKWVRTGLFALPALGILMLFAFSQRSPALARLLADGESEEGRALILPQLLAMVRDYQPWGAGFGAFEYAYRMREPPELVVPNYFNQAHNDWLQWLIEGGVVAGMLLGIALAAITVRLAQLVFRREAIAPPVRSRAWLGFAVLLVIGFASLVDYPLRVPLIMAVATIAFALLTAPSQGRKG